MRTVALTLILITLPLSGCLGQDEPTPDVLATFYPLAFLAERIGGDNVTVGTLVPGGVEPHDWEPSPRDLSRMGETQVILAQGLGFEPWLDGLRAQLARDTTTITTDGVETIRTTDGTVDPHTWLDPTRLSAQAERVATALTAAFPQHADAFAARLENLTAELAELDQELQNGLAECDKRLIIANHDAYGYLSTRYQFRVLPISGLSPDAEPDARTITRLIDTAREHDIKVIYFEELTSPRVARIIADEVGATTRVLSPLEGLTPEAADAGEDYTSQMRANLANLRDGMECT